MFYYFQFNWIKRKIDLCMFSLCVFRHPKNVNFYIIFHETSCLNFKNFNPSNILQFLILGMLCNEINILSAISCIILLFFLCACRVLKSQEFYFEFKNSILKYLHEVLVILICKVLNLTVVLF